MEELECALFQTDNPTSVFDKIDAKLIELETQRKIDQSTNENEFKLHLAKLTEVNFHLTTNTTMLEKHEENLTSLRIELTRLKELVSSTQEKFLEQQSKDSKLHLK